MSHSRLLSSQGCRLTIGVSARCCYACRVFIRTLSYSSEITTPATNGKVDTWTPPQGAPEEVKTAVLRNLLDALSRVIIEQERRQSRDSDAIPSSLEPFRSSDDEETIRSVFARFLT